MQARIAAKLEEERNRRKLTNRDFVALIKRFASEKEFSYRTYYLTMRQEQNLHSKRSRCSRAPLKSAWLSCCFRRMSWNHG